MSKSAYYIQGARDSLSKLGFPVSKAAIARSALLGGTIGAIASDEDHRIRGGLTGAAIGGGASYALQKALINRLTRRPAPAGAKTAQLKLGGLTRALVSTGLGAGTGAGLGALAAGEDNRLEGALAGGAVGGLAGAGAAALKWPLVSPESIAIAAAKGLPKQAAETKLGYTLSELGYLTGFTGLGAGIGAVASPEGERGQGALRGAAIGATSAVGLWGLNGIRQDLARTKWLKRREQVDRTARMNQPWPSDMWP